MEEKVFDFSKVKINKKITKEDIFNGTYNQVILFERYFGNTIDFKKNYTNRLRSDKTPGCKFKYKNGILKFNDWAKSKSYNVIEWVMEDYNLNYGEALNKISQDFDINNSNYNPKIQVPYEIEESHIEKIQITPKSYSKRFIDYYKDYLILPETCKEENVYCVDKLFIDGNNWYINPNELCIAYYFPDIDKIKILRPDQPKQYKWRTNVPNTYIDGLSTISSEDKNVILLKSMKDKMLIKQLGFINVLSTQMEGKFVITDETEEKLKDYNKIIWMDGDKTGKEVSEFYKNKGWNPIYFEDYFFDIFSITDPTDYTKEFKSTDLIKQLINEKIHI